MNDEEQKYLVEYNIHDFDVPLTSVDTVIFAIIDQQLHVLLVNRAQYPHKGCWALPGGFIDLNKDDTIEASAYRRLKQKTGIQSPYLEQVETIGNANRDKRGWSVTVLYYALIDINKTDASLLNEQAKWVNIDELDRCEMAFDHQLLINKARLRLIEKTKYTAIPVELLPRYFTLTELQNIFEIILGKSLPTKSFRRRIMAADIVEATDKSKLSGKRHAQLFTSTGKDRDYYFPRTLVI